MNPATPNLQALADELAVRALLDRYTDAVNRKDWEAYRRCWTPDAVWDLHPPINVRKTGLDDILTEVQRAVGGLEYFVQMTHAAVVELRGEQAAARVTLNEVGRVPDADAPFSILAQYADELVKHDGEWRFARRTYTVLHLEGQPPG